MRIHSQPLGHDYRETLSIGDLVQWFSLDGRTRKGIITKISLQTIGGREAFIAEVMVSNNKSNSFVSLPIIILDLISSVNRTAKAK